MTDSTVRPSKGEEPGAAPVAHLERVEPASSSIGPTSQRLPCSRSCGASDCCRMQAFEGLKRRDRLVGSGFRCWLAGYQHGDIAPWDLAFSDYEEILGAEPARRAIGDLGFWCRSVWRSRAREIEVFPHGCRRFCRDECLAISMIGSLQHRDGALAGACAAALLGVEKAPRPVLDAAALFATCLADAGATLPRKVALHAPVGAHERRPSAAT